MKRLLMVITILILCLILSGAADIYAADAAFPDMTGHWARELVGALVEKGVISGMDDGLFHPELPVTTAQFTTMVMRGKYGVMPPIGKHWASGYLKAAYDMEVIITNDYDEPDTPLERRFAARIGHEALVKILGEDDIQDITPAEEKLPDLRYCRTCIWPVAQCYLKGIMVGRPDGLFHNEDILTRAEAAVIIMRIFDPSSRIPQNIT